MFLEAYTSILLVGVHELEELYGVKVETADREMVESHSDEILKDAVDSDVAFCVVGDPFGATTHSDLLLRARQSRIDVAVIHNASIMNAIASCGLQLYRFGQVLSIAPLSACRGFVCHYCSVMPTELSPCDFTARRSTSVPPTLRHALRCFVERLRHLTALCTMQTVSVVFFTETWKPQSFYDKILANKKQKLHTLCLLDIKVKEPTLESLARGKPVYEPPRYMTINTCIEQLLEIEDDRQEGASTADTQCVGVARMGAIDEGEQGQLMVSGTMSQLLDVDFGGPLHSFVICGEVDDFEQHMLDLISVDSLKAQGKIQ